ncbi:hypothetical protein HYQ46_000163 [Verticillium longisporum]|nr:hypothetical protein HYQ46_000163 [Verticillium longisporum]
MIASNKFGGLVVMLVFADSIETVVVEFLNQVVPQWIHRPTVRIVNSRLWSQRSIVEAQLAAQEDIDRIAALEACTDKVGFVVKAREYTRPPTLVRPSRTTTLGGNSPSSRN